MSEPTPPIASSTVEYLRPMPMPVARVPRPRYWLHILLLLATCFTTLVMGARMQYNFQHGQPALSIGDDSVPYFPASWMFSHPERLLGGIPFMATLMLFFLAHEMGHYLYCRRYGVYATLPFFIPMPTLIGTMGAVILIRSRIRSRTALFDIGIAGPIAGFVVALAVLMVSLGWSKPMLTRGFGPAEYDLGYPLIFQGLHRLLVSMNLLHGPAALPLNRVLLHPVAIAAWVGMFATVAELIARRAARRRTHYLFDFAASTQAGLAADHPDSSAHGLLPVDGMVCVGDSSANQQLPASTSGGVATSFGWANLAGRSGIGDACSHADPGAVCPRVSARVCTASSGTVNLRGDHFEAFGVRGQTRPTACSFVYSFIQSF